MSVAPPTRIRQLRSAVLPSLLAVFLFGAGFVAPSQAQIPAQIPSVQAPAAGTVASPEVLDRVVAVVNNQVILASDLDDNIRLSVLDPNDLGQGVLTRQHALDQLISRTLIEQQLSQEDAEAIMPAQADVDTRLSEIRKELPFCVHQSCASEAGWKAFLQTHGLTLEQAEAYLRARMQILSFIEQRFQPSIRISRREIETYYHDTLLPQYQKGDSVPPLDTVAPRIEEILLQQQVNVLFDDWLANLRKQGDVEVLDPALETAAPQEHEAGRGSL
jgi:peptidyl-prolyl cis-trans isomerase SurA